ncbi:FadR/GntR family transcriptional regulator [Streptomyces sp. VRA16 Mangrove soil]|uniref:FadR/GntR family transcriptional regulator n=1 Tax=Streptomyces sp. VRA16 Mangrove soil TaxID=2817434 RepID=UPI001A9D3C56|nr:FCD domain-containing protein [Streptomyces sp. VRA16 Mangrove soil]MBO1331877.1 FadR family transcriptional regulator [Streptomyces sp. VRA16 Mangrove soil]
MAGESGARGEGVPEADVWSRHIRPVRAGGAAEAIARRLGELIGARMLVAGDRFPSEKALAEMFGVAPMTVRHSMAVLREEGLVETRRGYRGGTYVVEDVLSRMKELVALHPYPADQVEELTAWRQAVSGEASARAARRADAEGHRRLRELAARTHELLPDADGYRTADAAFHLAIAELSGSRRLWEAEQGIQHELTLLLAAHPGGAEARSTPGRLHEPLTRAIVAGDAERARAEFRVHAQATLDMCLLFSRQTPVGE